LLKTKTKERQSEKRRLRLFGHFLRMEDSRITHQGVRLYSGDWELIGYKRKEKQDGHRQTRSQGHGHYLRRS